MQKPSVLITGANGFVGARLCQEFLTHNFSVCAGVRPHANTERIRELPVVYRFGNICTDDSLQAMVEGVDFIVHNAGVVKARAESTFFEVNERGTLHLIEAVLQFNPSVKRFVYVSSLAAAGPSRSGYPVREDDRPSPITNYGGSKLAAERVVLRYSDQIPTVIVRPPGVYGPGEREIFSIFKTVHRRVKPMIGDPERKLQLVHVDDLARGIFLAATSSCKSGSIFFIAEDRAYSMQELMTIVEKASGKTAVKLALPGWLFETIAAASEMGYRAVGATPMLTHEKAGELLASWEVDTGKAREQLGFVSKIPFADGVRQTFEWYKRAGWLK